MKRYLFALLALALSGCAATTPEYDPQDAEAKKWPLFLLIAQAKRNATCSCRVLRYG